MEEFRVHPSVQHLQRGKHPPTDTVCGASGELGNAGRRRRGLGGGLKVMVTNLLCGKALGSMRPPKRTSTL